jgi:uncharacterized protein YyaL (SSP411 family)
MTVTIRVSICFYMAMILIVSLPSFAADKPSTIAAQASSPYLEYHANDLVHWQPWTQATLKQAQDSGKLILVSSGYFACHYCHVMKRESFENPEIAAYINEHFIPVLIDRELNPVLDAQLLQFMEAIDAAQGWPLTVILTPAGHPLVGTVYQPPDAFMGFLKKIQGLWTEERTKWEAVARSATQTIITRATVPAFIIKPAQQGRFVEAFLEQALLVADDEDGGFGDAAKYPLSPQLMALLQLQEIKPNEQLERHLRLTLDAMASRGLRDPIDGSFYRYTTDRSWRTPHYEKMLYDNAQLALVYLEAARILKEPSYLMMTSEALDSLSQAFAAKNGGLVASLSAVDDRGIDGGYYLWSDTELKALLNAREYEVVKQLWPVMSTITEERHYLPVRGENLAGVAAALTVTEKQIRSWLDSALRKIDEARSKRSLPRDRKRIAAWNGLALLAFSRAAQLTGELGYRSNAERLYRFIADQLWVGDQLQRTASGGEAELADYAYLASGLLAYAELSGKPEHDRLFKQVAQQAWDRFHVDGFWRRLEGLDLLLPYTVYPVTLPDTEMPSPSAMLIRATLKGDSLIDDAYHKLAQQALRTGDSNMAESPFFYGTQILTLVSEHE